MSHLQRLCALAVLMCALVAGSGTVHAASPRVEASQAQVVQVAESYLGYRYSYIGNTPAQGFSCIGLVHWVYARLGYSVPSYLGGAWSAFPHVGRWSLVPGDIVFFGNTAWAGLSHAAIYIGGGRVIAADNFQSGVRVDNLDDAYWRSHYWGAARVL